MTQADLEKTLAAREKLLLEQEQRIARLEDKLGKLGNAAAHLYQIAEDAERVFAHIKDYDTSDPRFGLLLKELRRRMAKYRALIR